MLSTATFAYVRILDERDRADASARAATKAQLLTEEANRQLKIADRERLAMMLASLEKHAANVLLSSKDANRRLTGLELLRQAATLGPDPAFRVRLRDQALAFLSIRDIEARPPIETAEKPQHGLIFVDKGQADGRALRRRRAGDLGRRPARAGRVDPAADRAVPGADGERPRAPKTGRAATGSRRPATTRSP